MKDVRPHGHVIDTDFDVEAVFAAVDHVSDLLARVMPELPLRVDAPDMGNVLPRTVRVRLRNTRDLVGHNCKIAPLPMLVASLEASAKP